MPADDGPAEESRLPVYVVHYAAPDWCSATVSSLLGSESVTADVAVVDNGSAPGQPLVHDVLPASVRVITAGRNLGYAGAANLALDDWSDCHPTSDLCLLTSHDLQVGAHTLGDLVAIARAHPEVGVLGPDLGEGDAGLPLADGDHAVQEREWVSGTCMLLRRECVAACGRFDQRYGSYVEDYDYCIRATDAGWRVALATQVPAQGRGTADTAARRVAMEANEVLFVAKRYGRRAALRPFRRIVARWLLTSVTAAAPWRPPQRRSDSRYWRDLHARAMKQAATLGWRMHQ